MDINNNGFKVSTVGSAAPSGLPTDTSAQTAEEVDDLFEVDDPAAGTTSSGSDPFADYTCGELQGGVVTSASSESVSESWLENFPPSWEEISVNIKDAINHIDDVILPRYEQAKIDLQALKAAYEKALASGKLSAGEAQHIVKKMELVDKALSRCSQEVEKLVTVKSERKELFRRELIAMEDLDGDNKIADLYYIHINEDGEKTYIDLKTRRAVATPVMDPDYRATIGNDSFELLDPSDALCGDDAMTDAHLRLTEDAVISNQNTAACPIDIGIPEYIWVQRDPDDQSSILEDYHEGYGYKMALAGEFAEQNGEIVQALPDNQNLSKFMQVQVAKVELTSEIATKTLAGSDPVYNHVVKFLDQEGNLISKIRIEGFQTQSDLPSAVETFDFGKKYVAASNVGFAFHAANRASPIQIDASQFHSTAVHQYSDLESKADIGAPSDQQGQSAYYESIGRFTSPDYTTEVWNKETKEWEEQHYAIGDTNDRYCPPDGFLAADAGGAEIAGEDDDGTAGSVTRKGSEFTTGIFIMGDLRGDIIGSTHNDFIWTAGVDEFSQYALDHMPEERRRIIKDDPFYSNFVTGRGGHDVVISGKGDNYISKADFVWIKESNDVDQHFITLSDPTLDEESISSEDLIHNRKHFVHGAESGGQYFIDNPAEYEDANHVGENEAEVEAAKGSYRDDWYEILGGTANFADSTDDDVANSPSNIDTSSGMDSKEIESYRNEIYEEWLDELQRVPEPDENIAESDLDALLDDGPAQAALNEEMDAFFGGIDDEISAIMSEFGT